MEQITKKQLKDVKTFYNKFIGNHKITPLRITESGSRMWGFASPDSDFDIRGIFIPDKKEYFSISKNKDQYDLIEEPYDIVLFSIDKYFNLISKSNPNLIEQLQSPITYHNSFDEYKINFDKFKKKIFANINLKTLYFHYISMAHKNFDKYIKTNELFTYKKCLYVLRSMFCAEYILQLKKVPPVNFNELISQLDIDKNYLYIIDTILEKKSKSEEKTEVVNKEDVKIVINKYFQKLENAYIEDTGDKVNLMKILNDTAIQIKHLHYGGEL